MISTYGIDFCNKLAYILGLFPKRHDICVLFKLGSWSSNFSFENRH